jgi:hypothetical protein
VSAIKPEAREVSARLATTTTTNLRRRKSPWVVAGVALVVAGVALAIADPFSSKGTPSGVADNSAPTSLFAVARQDLTSQTQVAATLGYASTYSVVNQAQGMVTAVPAVGQVVSQGQVIYQVSGALVVLLYGSTPAYRNLSEGEFGDDIEELNYDLVAMGEYARGEKAPTSDIFDSATEYGVKKLQATLGVMQSGTLNLGQVIFLPTSARITAVSATLGAAVQPSQPVLSATSTTRQVSIALDATQQSEVAVGDKVAITLPNNQTTPGVIASVGTVASTTSASSSSDSSSNSSGNGGSGSSNPTITVLVTPTDSAATGTWDQAPVNVTITTASVSNALVVPVNALVALSGGGYSVEVVGANGIHHLMSVSLGLFDDADGLVQVTGSGLVAGQRVVVPES